jgi:hypothetical protein
MRKNPRFQKLFAREIARDEFFEKRGADSREVWRAQSTEKRRARAGLAGIQLVAVQGFEPNKN